jgi:hypothetical protein
VTTAVREAPHHNTVTCVKHYGCKRVECLDRVRAYQNEWRRRRRTDPTLVDATPVREHLERLAEAGVGPRRVATLTGLAVETVAGFTRPYGSGGGRRYGRKHKVRPDVAAKILAIDPDSTVPGVTDATGSRRRIQALNAAGWPTVVLADRLPTGRVAIRTIHRQTHLYARTADAIAGLYDELRNKRPEKNGVLTASAHRARLRARRSQWPSPRYWADRMDVIDDPDFEPLYGVTRGELLAADARELLAYGVPVEQAAERLGVTKAHLYQELLRHPEPEPAVDAELAA